jgi:hypothetical protein
MVYFLPSIQIDQAVRRLDTFGASGRVYFSDIHVIE